MIRIAVCFWTIMSLGCSANAQNTTNTQSDSIFNELMYHNDSKFCFGCGRTGTNSKNLGQFDKLIATHRLDLIEKLVHSELPGTAYYATEIILMAQKKKKWIPSDTTLERISNLRTSEERVYFDSGCVQMGKSYTIKDLLERKKSAHYHKTVRSEIKFSFKYYYH